MGLVTCGDVQWIGEIQRPEKEKAGYSAEMSARTNTRKLTSLKTEQITDGEDMKDLNVMTRIYVMTRNYYVSILCKFRKYLHDVIIELEALSPRRRLRYEKVG